MINSTVGIFATSVLAGSIALSGAARAQSFPSKPIRIVVQFPAGNGADINARLLAHQLSLSMGQQVVVENRPGAGGVAAVQSVAKAEPDGHTLLHIANINAISASLFKALPYAAYCFSPRKIRRPTVIKN